MPRPIEPMLLRSVRELPPRAERWSVEFKWDGARAMAYVRGGEVALLTRNGRNVAAAFPEVAQLAAALGGRDAILDGELVAFTPSGTPTFAGLLSRLNRASGRPSAIRAPRRLRRAAPRRPLVAGRAVPDTPGGAGRPEP
jgi:bifunctional non-homologous end joining protein LigD